MRRLGDVFVCPSPFYGHHAVEPTANGSRATLALRYEGPIARFIGRLTRGITNWYVALEAAGLRARSEAQD